MAGRELTWAERPAEALSGVVLWATALFYLAEKDENERVNDVWDAFHYVTTALSVGYANLFPVTPVGKLIGGLVMTVGPALTARALDPPAGSSGEEAIVGRLDAILAELRRLSPAS